MTSEIKVSGKLAFSVHTCFMFYSTESQHLHQSNSCSFLSPDLDYYGDLELHTTIQGISLN